MFMYVRLYQTVRVTHVQFTMLFIICRGVLKRGSGGLGILGWGHFAVKGIHRPAGPTQAACGLAFMLATEGTQPQVGRAVSCQNLST